MCIALHGKPISELQDETSPAMWDHSVTCHPTQVNALTPANKLVLVFLQFASCMLYQWCTYLSACAMYGRLYSVHTVSHVYEVLQYCFIIFVGQSDLFLVLITSYVGTG